MNKHARGEVVGGHCHGYFLFEVVEHDGLGEATFLFDWDEKGEGCVKEWAFKVY